jgi:AcrR family transcriptional regulator
MNSHTPKRKLDRRSARTRDRLGDALLELVQEKPFDAITVQDVIDRAGVGRSTFYVHFRDKGDLFLSDADEFLEIFATGLSERGDESERLAPVAEFFAHVGENRQLHRRLVEAGILHDFLELAHGHFARGIERRLAEVPRGRSIAPERRAVVAYALAGAMLSLMSWWLDRDRPSSPQEMDDLFHTMAWSGAAANGT